MTRWILGIIGIVCILGSSPAVYPQVGQAPPAASPHAGELDFGQAPIQEEDIVKVNDSESDRWIWFWVVLSIMTGAGLVAGISFFVLRRFGERLRFPWSVSDLPGSARVMITLVLLLFGLVHLFGMTTAYILANVINESAGEYFFYMKIGKLTGMTHAHLFGTVVMHLVVTMAFLLTTVRERWKVILITATLLGSPMDIASWWLIKYVSPLFEALALAGEVTSEAGYLTMTFITLVQLWRAGVPVSGGKEGVT